MPKKTKESTSSEDPILTLLYQIQSVELSGGMPLCAPKALQETVSALRYTPSGVLPPSDKLFKMGILNYLEKNAEKTFEVGSGKKSKSVVVEYYILSEKGKTALAEQEIKQQAEQQKKLATVEGLKSVLEENRQQSHEITKQFQKLAPSPVSFQPFLEETQRLQQQLQENFSSFQQQALHIFENMNQMLQMTGKKFTEVIQTAHVEIQRKQQENYQQVATEVNRHTEQEKFLTQALQEHLQFWSHSSLPEPQKEIQKTQENIPSPSFSYQKLEEQISEEILKTLSDQYAEEIPKLYQLIKMQHFDISPGHFNDILWKLSRENKVLLKTWDRSLYDLKEPQHAIVRKEIYFFVRRFKKEEVCY